MDKLQRFDEVQSVLEAETREEEPETPQKDSGKCKRETQEVGYAIKGY